MVKVMLQQVDKAAKQPAPDAQRQIIKDTLFPKASDHQPSRSDPQPSANAAPPSAPIATTPAAVATHPKSVAV